MSTLQRCAGDRNRSDFCSANAFQPNPDIAGPGIMNAFFVISLLVCTLGLFVYLPYQFYISRTIRKTTWDSDWDRERYKHTVHCICKFFNAVTMSCCDQQVFTGFALAIDLLSLQKCQTSAYHFDIILLLLLMSCATHAAAIALVGRYFGTIWTYIPRAALSVTLYGLTGTLFHRPLASTQPFPMDVPSHYTYKNLALAQPAVCYQTSELYGTRKAYQTGVFGKLFITLIVSYILAYLENFVRHKPWDLLRRPDRRQRQKPKTKWFILSFIIEYSIVIYCTAVIICSYVRIRKLRSFMGTYVAKAGLLDDDGANPEDDVAGFAQFIAIILTMLTLLVAVDTASESRKDYRKFVEGHEEKEQAAEQKEEVERFLSRGQQHAA